MYQAKLFASGKVYAEDPLYDRDLPFYDCLATYCFRDDQGHRFSQYPPGWPALLAVGVNLGTPWLINPLLGALLIFLMLEYVAANGQGGGESRFAVVALMKLNPVLLEEDRHRRINVLVGAADFESALTQRRRHGAHGRAANPDEMKFLERGFHKRLFHLVA
jgi:hypothetical protein